MNSSSENNDKKIVNYNYILSAYCVSEIVLTFLHNYYFNPDNQWDRYYYSLKFTVECTMDQNGINNIAKDT